MAICQTHIGVRLAPAQEPWLCQTLIGVRVAPAQEPWLYQDVCLQCLQINSVGMPKIEVSIIVLERVYIVTAGVHQATTNSHRWGPQ